MRSTLFLFISAAAHLCAGSAQVSADAPAPSTAAASPAALLSAAPLRRQLQLQACSGTSFNGYFGICFIGGDVVVLTTGTFAGVIVGPAVALALLSALATWCCMRKRAPSPAAAAAGAPRGTTVTNPLPRAEVNAREAAATHWQAGAGELPPGWDWDSQGGPVVYVRGSRGRLVHPCCALAPMRQPPAPRPPAHTAHHHARSSRPMARARTRTRARASRSTRASLRPRRRAAWTSTT